ncbi:MULTISPECIES: hypothetical protein [Microbacterium]|uniref:hypothetical protein n=1 Tax=Microbacterium TaxID=33882 RepID=UPI0023DAFC8B|nr:MULTISPECIES: hypothetical protein [Microbacterium]MDF2045229.1 hypothetical protein [Microbacterium sp. Kw_RZR3]MDQ1074244.1 hypothetical protein [Microbacterium sp. SORGH_AS_0969]MDQ1114471.1 hypothetical protein [Microbacterium testaceum]
MIPAIVAAACVMAGVVLLVLNSVLVYDPGPFSGEPRDRLAVWPAGLVLLGTGSLGMIAAAFVAVPRPRRH